jgi:hypothetical protein
MHQPQPPKLSLLWFDGRQGEPALEAFLADMGPKPTPQHVLGILDTTGDFEPGNVEWMPRSAQLRSCRR